MIKNKIKNYPIYIVVFFIITVSFCIIQKISNIYPFGTYSNLNWDLSIQYTDFFGYYKRVLQQDENFIYSLTKGLGGSTFGLFAFYLSSPFNVLLLFFTQKQIPLFVFVTTVLKISLAGTCFCIYLQKRFSQIAKEYLILLSVSYGLSEYMIYQSMNIMWLDGCILLPLLLLAVYRFISENKYGMLYFLVAATIICNWYTGYMNCLILPVYGLVELFLMDRWNQKENKKENFVFLLKKEFQLIFWEALGVLLSFFMFLPVVLELRNGKGQVGENIFQFAWNGKIGNLSKTFFIGYNPGIKDITIYFGLLPMMFVAAFFFHKNISKLQKMVAAIFALFLVLSLWLKPLENIWNGLRTVESYYFRYSYVMIACFIFLAAFGINQSKEIEKKSLDISAGIFECIILFFGLRHQVYYKYIIFSFLMVIVYVLLIHLHWRGWKRILIVCITVELIINGYILLNRVIEKNDAKDYVTYVEKEQKLLAELKSYDQGTYRIDQTSKRWNAADVNESMSYGFHGIANYSSTYDTNLALKLAQLGYSKNRTVYSLYKEPNLALDSLFGLKYLISSEDYGQFQEVTQLKAYLGKRIYYNKDALPMGYAVSDKAIGGIDSQKNVFEITNQMYSNILGKKVEIFSPVRVTVQDTGSTEQTYFLPKQTQENCYIYGYSMFTSENIGCNIDHGRKIDPNYSLWMSEPVFNIGNGNQSHIVTFTNDIQDDSAQSVIFYALNKKLLDEVTAQIKGNAVDRIAIDKNKIKISYTAKEETNLLLSIPYNTNWDIRINGKKVSYEKALDMFISMKTEKGSNQIEMTYHTPGVLMGIGVSCISFGIYLIVTIKKNKKRGKI